MSNMPNWLVPEDDRTFPTGALWRQWLCDNDFVVCIENCILFSLIKINNSTLFKFNYEIIVQFKKEEEDTVHDKMII
jgi:hypothetical protein